MPLDAEVRLGLTLVERPATQGVLSLDPGLYVRSVSGSSEQAGLRLGGRVLAVNEVGVERIAELDAALNPVGPGDTVAVLIKRETITTFVPVSIPRFRAATTRTEP